MKKLLLILLVFVGIGSGQSSAQSSTKLIPYEGQEYWVNGLNVAWNKFGGDFGNHMMWGTMYDTTWFENFFTECEDYGVNVIRLWIHCDGRSSPEFDVNGFTTGFDTDFFIDLDDCFRRGKAHNVMIMPCIWSFDMCKDFTESAGPFAGHHEDLLNDDAKMKSYIDNAWIPLVERYKDQCNLFAWEVCNEPEWALDRSRYQDTLWSYRSDYIVPIERMQKLTGWMAAEVHKRTDKLVTTGSAAIRWNSDVAPAVGNIWSDKALQAATNNMEGAYLDFYQVHYYDYMVPLDADLYDTTKSVDYWKIDKPIIIGETPADSAKAKIHKVDEVIQLAKKNGFAGIMYWSYNGYDGIGGWKDFREVLKSFKDENPNWVEPGPCPCTIFDMDILKLRVESKGKKDIITWNAEDPLVLANFQVEYSTDNEKFVVCKKIKSEGSDVVEYSTKIKNRKQENRSFRIVQKDVYGYEKTSEAVSR